MGGELLVGVGAGLQDLLQVHLLLAPRVPLVPSHHVDQPLRQVVREKVHQVYKITIKSEAIQGNCPAPSSIRGVGGGEGKSRERWVDYEI